MSTRPSVLLTGASGILGTAIRESWSGAEDLLGVTRSGGRGILACDLSDASQIQSVLDKRLFSAVVHTAAFSSVDGCEKDAAAAARHNILATQNVAALCEAQKIPLIHISTDYVFNGKKSTPYSENDAACPVQIYGLSKWIAEWHALRCPNSVVVRVSWLFGRGAGENFINKMIQKLKSDSSVGVLDDQTTAPTYAVDLAGWLSLLLRQLCERPQAWQKKEERVLHMCNSGQATRYEMTLELQKIMGASSKKIFVLDKRAISGWLAVRPKYSVMNNALFQKRLNTGARDWRAALEDFVRGEGLCAS